MKPAFKCAVLSIVFSFPMSIAFVLFFRFPIPLGGYIGPVSAISIDYSNVLEILKMLSVAWVVYGVLGGFIVLAIGGAVASQLTVKNFFATQSNKTENITLRAICVSFLGCGVLVILDFIIGPW